MILSFMEHDPVLKLIVLSDNQELDVPLSVLKECKTLYNQYESVPTGSSINVPQMSSSLLKLLLDLTTSLVNMSNTQRATDVMYDTVAKMTPDEYRDAVSGTNYLDNQLLLDGFVMCLAKRLCGKTTEEMRVILGVQDDFTEEEKAEIRKKYSWLFPTGQKFDTNSDPIQ